MRLDMNKRGFRLLVVSGWVLCVVAVVVVLSTRHSVPPEVENYIERQRSRPATTKEMIMLYADLVLLAVTVAISIGLFFFKRWARTLLLPIYGLSFLLTPITPLFVETGWSHLVFSLGDVLGGMIIALAYYSPISDLFGTSTDV
jgi:hypothetical protein